MKSPKISVVLSSFNGGNFLLDAVRSILGQSYTDWELILIDDGSDDDSIMKVKELADHRIRVFSDGLNLGLAARLNQGVGLARGRYIARMDADDLCFPERFEKQIIFLESNPSVDLVGGQVAVFSPGNFALQSRWGISHDQICANPWIGIRVPHPTWMAKKSWFSNFKYHVPEYVRAEDQELLLRGMAKSKYALLPDVVLAYRQGEFKFSKTLRGRRSLLLAQLHYFIQNKLFVYVALATFYFFLKLAIDIVLTVPWLSRLYYLRMGSGLDAKVQIELEKLNVRI